MKVKDGAWGKRDDKSGETHHLAHHSADVAAVFLALLGTKIFRDRFQRACGETLSVSQTVCLGVFAFLHDIGKIAPAFQAKGWPGFSETKTLGHLICGRLWLRCVGKDETVLAESLAGCLTYIRKWPECGKWFDASFLHHGRPVSYPDDGEYNHAFDSQAFDSDYKWKEQEDVMGQALLKWFPKICTSAPPFPTPAVLHFFAGLLALADWIGSDRDAFPFEADFRLDYWKDAQERASRRIREIGLDVIDRQLKDRVNWNLISPEHQPHPAQTVVGNLSLDERIVLLEDETGSGKTEAGVWHFARLYEAGKVSGLYFAVPTRTAAIQLHQRLNEMMKHMFVCPPEAVLAIPGQIVSGTVRGTPLPEFKVLWDDESDGTNVATRWAAENSTRFLAAQIAVGTIDQAMLGGLHVKHAHMRGSALSRSLLIIDEVHASDTWMTEIQRELLQGHMAVGGYAMLMSATLGSVARSVWLDKPPSDYETACELPYPTVWTKSRRFDVPVRESKEKKEEKKIAVEAVNDWSPEKAAKLALDAARKGARVLVIRNTVDRARETWKICNEEAPELMFRAESVSTLHHSRFAAEDRWILNEAVETVLGKTACGDGVIVIGTQTLEQSLDIDADYIITDLCPMDVLLQRFGRLHRHSKKPPKKPRAALYERPQAAVLFPEAGLDSLLENPENGLGVWTAKDGSLCGVYENLAMSAATLEQIRNKPEWSIPSMNRRLVESATHPEELSRIAESHGDDWLKHVRDLKMKHQVHETGAQFVVLDRSADLPKAEDFSQDARIRTRLGDEGIVLKFEPGTKGVFGEKIKRLALPAHWSHGLSEDDRVKVVPDEDDRCGMTIHVGEKATFRYDSSGLQKEKIQ